MGVLQEKPNTVVIVENKRTGKTERAQADKVGVVRDSDGRCFSPGTYRIKFTEQ